MKTNVPMIRDEAFVQRTKDYYFNATFLIKKWNERNPDKEKQLAQFFATKETKQYIEQLKKEGIEIPYIAGRGKGNNAGTWVHPNLFVDLAMWVSIEFKSKVLSYVVDQLIKMRCDAGDYHKEMCATIMSTYIEIYGTKPPAMLFINESRMIKQIANLDIDRNEMTEKDLSRITILQKVNSNLITKNVGKASRVKQLTMINESLL